MDMDRANLLGTCFCMLLDAFGCFFNERGFIRNWVHFVVIHGA